MLKHICAEMVKRVRIGAKHGFYKTGLFPKYRVFQEESALLWEMIV
jgi:hypothetical protein